MLDHKQKAREEEGGQHGEESGIPKLVGVDTREPGSALRNGKRKHESGRGEKAEGGESEMAEVKEVGMHGLGT